MEAGQQRPRPLLPLGRNLHSPLGQCEILPLALASLPQILLHRVELGDPRQSGFHPRRVQPPAFVELPSGVRPTAHLDNAALGFQVDAVVTVEGVGLQVPAIIFEKSGRPVALVTGA